MFATAPRNGFARAAKPTRVRETALRYGQLKNEECMIKKIVLFLLLLSQANHFSFSDCNKHIIDKENVLQSTYKKSRGDGYSWRWRYIKFIIGPKNLTKEVLCSTKWIPSAEPDDASLLLMFYLDDVFKLGYASSGVVLSGNYQVISDNEVKLYNFKKGNAKNIYFERDDIILKLFVNQNDFWFSEKIASTDNKFTFYPLGSESEENKEYIYQGIPVYKTCGKYVSTLNLKIRTKPNIKSKTVNNPTYTFPFSHTKPIDLYIQGTSFEVLGRTTKKEKVYEYNNYWYLTKFYIYNGFKFGWVYGEFIEPYDESKKEIYEKQIKQGLKDIGWEGYPEDL
jgi:hypothetical protein